MNAVGTVAKVYTHYVKIGWRKEVTLTDFVTLNSTEESHLKEDSSKIYDLYQCMRYAMQNPKGRWVLFAKGNHLGYTRSEKSAVLFCATGTVPPQPKNKKKAEYIIYEV